MRLRVAVILLGLLGASSAALAQAPAVEKKPLLLDTALGGGIDDAFALALVLASPELELRGVTSVGGNTQQRAMMLCRFLTMTGRRHIAVAAGSRTQPARALGGQYQYYHHPDVVFDRTTKPVKESAVDFLYGRLKAQPAKISLLALGPLTNVARLLKEKGDCKPWIHTIVWAGGSFDGKGEAEDNCRADVASVRTVLESGVPLVIVPADAAKGLSLTADDRKRLFAPATPLSWQIECLYQLWDKDDPPLNAVLAAAMYLDERFATVTPSNVTVDDKGVLHKGEGKANAGVASGVRGAAFVKWYVDRMANCVRPGDRPVQPVQRGRMPYRVHVAEDYDTDIERHWWMSGKAETKEVPPGSRRACRGVLTHDFDDLLGNPKAMYTAVIFNPVPGPPMGKNTRLSFRYRLKGSDRLRVQIYSLSNGYHRHLVLADLPQGRWRSATVDMTAARRPDGTGGPLSEGERIDDIQFYTDPKAELIVDDIVLYDAAAEEKRPFPKRILFTAWFDSGKQGKEWPGSFEIVPEKGVYRNAARSVDDPATATPWLRLQLRGERTLGAATHLSFRYRLHGAEQMRVALVNRTARARQVVRLPDLARDRWAETVVNFSADAVPSRPVQGDRVDEILFLLPKGAELLLDDVLLYEPGS
jgi:inosine-uridine nucleoside N-ribohydrolase